MKKLFLLSMSLLILVSCGGRELLRGDISQQRIADGLVWKHVVSDDLNGDPANIHILDVDLKAFDGDVEILWVKDTLIKTSVLASEADALAGINGSFFDMRQGGAVVYLQVDGKTIAENYDNSSFCCSGAFTIDHEGTMDIVAKPDTGWGYSPLYRDMMAGGPILINENVICEKDSIRFNLNRHPRTAVGLTENEHLLLVTVDGRHKEAAGMTIHELTRFMQDLGCKDALNFDGGGSTTMYIKDKSETGVVNCPSDNKTFDYGGERSVANALILK